MKKILLFSLLLAVGFFTWAQPKPRSFIYKKIDTVTLKMKIYYPNNYKKDKIYPAIVLFFGGGWNSGTIDQFKNQAIHFAAKGMIAITPDYRVNKRQHTSPFESVKDGRSAIRYVRAHAHDLGVDPNRIVAGGGSAGGHVAAATDLTNIDEATDDLNISARPNALILFNPVFNNGPGEYGYDRIGERYAEISPYHNILKGAAPTLVFLGTKDHLISVQTAKDYQERMRSVGSRCDLFLYEGQGHGFFNFSKGKEYYEATLRQSDQFLKELGYMK
ncbi:alpha/beta hydrolase [Niabella insulamsoli]|uniref:alpha/beta hydrolase n=1 Tax=Niabella insulamsoli TaxID=3144874 RepID=UPI0031FDF286